MISISIAHNYSRPSQSDHFSLMTTLNAVPSIFHTFVTNRSLSLVSPQFSDHLSLVTTKMQSKTSNLPQFSDHLRTKINNPSKLMKFLHCPNTHL